MRAKAVAPAAPKGAGGADQMDAGAGEGGNPGSGGSGPAPDGGMAVNDGGAVTYFAPIPAGMTSLFDGKTLNGWVGSNIWSVNAADMAIEGKSQTGGQLLKTKDDYLDFRLILTERMVATTNHMGICFWGTRPGTGYGGCIDVIPPSGSLSDCGGGGMQPGGVGSANNPSTSTSGTRWRSWPTARPARSWSPSTASRPPAQERRAGARRPSACSRTPSPTTRSTRTCGWNGIPRSTSC